mmetsp:Transcript_10955/g.26530  ORF Transcript_10955/g.26530 Transcript_10955/m.26530 type:complete len:310 (+) Transcript_10955:1298-2227(+)
MLFPVVGDGLVESDIFVLGDFVGLAHPDGLGVVQVLPFVADLLDLLGLLFLLGFLLIDFLDLWLVVVTFVILVIVIIIGDFLFGGLFGVKLDGEANEFRVLLDQVLNTLLLKVFRHVFLEVKDDSGSTTNSRVGGFSNGERTTGLRTPYVAFISVALGDNFDLIGDEVGRVETNTELTNHTDIGTGGKSLHESLGSRLGDGTKVVDQIGLGHTDTGILNGECVVGLVGDKLDVKFRFRIQDGAVGQRLVTDLVEGITGIGNQLTKKDLLVGVEGVDNQRQKLVDISGEGIAFGFTHLDNRFDNQIMRHK